MAGLSAALIVKDEEAALPGCLAALAGVVEAVVVYDTGSTDGTVSLARAAGAVVAQGFWDADFARARNEALVLVRTPWALVVDADERVIADVAALARLLAGADARRVDAVAVTVRNDRPAPAGGPYRHLGLRVLRHAAVRYRGRVHEQPHRVDGAPLRSAEVAEDVLRVEHHGYADRPTLRRKAARNAALARTELDQLVAAGAGPDALAVPLLDLGRALAGAGRAQEAVDAFETLRALAPEGSSPWCQATDHLARLLLGAGRDEAVLALAGQLRAAGGAASWSDWLAGQALAQLGRPDEAHAVLSRVGDLVDTGGRRYDHAPLVQVRSFVADLLALARPGA